MYQVMEELEKILVLIFLVHQIVEFMVAVVAVEFIHLVHQRDVEELAVEVMVVALDQLVLMQVE
jgi:hypothetical protein